MNKFTSLIASLALAAPAFAQTADAPNRLLVHTGPYEYKGYVIENVDSITFAKVDGDVYADIDIIDATTEMIKLSVTRSEACRAFKINVVPGTVASQLTDDRVAISYLNRLNSPTYYEDFSAGELTGINLNSNSDYQVITVGIDEYGVETGVCRADFKTPAPAIVGDPKVEAEVIEIGQRSFTVKFTPNDDVTTYYTIAGPKGDMQRQYEQYGAMFGFTNFEQMIKGWSQPMQGVDSFTWTSMEPNTDYEVLITCADKNGELTPYQSVELRTLGMGGDGEAYVDITPGKYVLADWGGEELLPSQFFTFTPNNQSSCYRFGVYTAKQYDENSEAIKAELRSDPPQPDMAYWFFYEPLTTDFQINPSTEVVAVAAAKNINGEWGKVKEVRYTTPAEVEGGAYKAAPSVKVGSRNLSKLNATSNVGKAPAIKINSIQLK